MNFEKYNEPSREAFEDNKEKGTEAGRIAQITDNPDVMSGKKYAIDPKTRKLYGRPEAIAARAEFHARQQEQNRLKGLAEEQAIVEDKLRSGTLPEVVSALRKNPSFRFKRYSDASRAAFEDNKAQIEGLRDVAKHITDREAMSGKSWLFKPIEGRRRTAYAGAEAITETAVELHQRVREQNELKALAHTQALKYDRIRSGEPFMFSDYKEVTLQTKSGEKYWFVKIDNNKFAVHEVKKDGSTKYLNQVEMPLYQSTAMGKTMQFGPIKTTEIVDVELEF